MENIKPVYPQSNPNKCLSHQEFQELLNSWCQEKGVLSELRLQLRYKLFSLLKYSIIGKDIAQGNVQCPNLSNQAINLIVAEYLLQSKCYYSLSVFNTEAKFTNLLPDNLIKSDEDKQDSKLYYNRENISKIMDLIGLTNSSPYYDQLLSMYFDKQEEKSILGCLIILLCKVPDVKEEINGEQFKYLSVTDAPDDEIKFIQEIEEMLTHTSLPSSYVKKIIQYITFFNEVKKMKQEKEFLTSIKKLKNEKSDKDKIIEELNASTNLLQNQLLKVDKHYRKTKTRLENILQKESMSNENLLLQSKNTECNVKNEEINENIKTKVEEKQICQLTHCNQVCASNIKLTEDLISENMALKKENRKQKEALQKLFLIYKDLLSKFKNCRRDMIYASDNEFHEEVFSNILLGKSTRVEEQSQGDVEPSDVSSDSGTDEILNQARIALQNLEDETKEVEDKFKYYRYT